MSAIKSLFPTVDSAEVRIKGAVKPASRPGTAKPLPRQQKTRPIEQPKNTRATEPQPAPTPVKKENSVISAYKFYSPVKKTQAAPVLGKNIDIKA